MLGHPCDCPEAAYVHVTMAASLAAFSCIVLARAEDRPNPPLVAAMGASIVAVVAAFAVGWDLLVLPALTIMLAALPAWLLLTRWSD